MEYIIQFLNYELYLASDGSWFRMFHLLTSLIFIYMIYITIRDLFNYEKEDL